MLIAVLFTIADIWKQSKCPVTDDVWYIYYIFIRGLQMATHSSTLAWKIPRMEKPGRLQSVGWKRIGHNWAASLSFLSGGSYGKESACNAGDLGSIPRSARSPGEGNGNPFQYSCLVNSMDKGAWLVIAANSRTWLSDFHSLTHSYNTHILFYLYMYIYIYTKYVLYIYTYIIHIYTYFIYVCVCVYIYTQIHNGNWP